VELETFNNEGVDQSTESVDNSFASFSEAGVGVDEEASVDVSIDEESNKSRGGDDVQLDGAQLDFMAGQLAAVIN